MLGENRREQDVLSYDGLIEIAFVDCRYFETATLQEIGEIVAVDPQVIGLSEHSFSFCGIGNAGIFEGRGQAVLLRNGQNAKSPTSEDTVNLFDSIQVPGNMLQHVAGDHAVERFIPDRLHIGNVEFKVDVVVPVSFRKEIGCFVRAGLLPNEFRHRGVGSEVKHIFVPDNFVEMKIGERQGGEQQTLPNLRAAIPACTVQMPDVAVEPIRFEMTNIAFDFRAKDVEVRLARVEVQATAYTPQNPLQLHGLGTILKTGSFSS